MSQREALRLRLDAAELVHLDPRVFAYHLIGATIYSELTGVVFNGMRSRSFRTQTSSFALYQLLTEVYRRGEEERAAEISKMITVHTGLELVPVTSEVAVQAANVRAQLGGRPERAVQIATALIGGADVYLTEGSGLRRIVGMAVVNLEDYL
jgi:predicted nucleic acid-binding protein